MASNDEIRNECAPDRGAFSSLIFNRCARGFTLSAQGTFERNGHGPHFAFDRVEDVAAWLVEQYGPAPKPAVAKAVRKPAKRRRR